MVIRWLNHPVPNWRVLPLAHVKLRQIVSCQGWENLVQSFSIYFRLFGHFFIPFLMAFVDEMHALNKSKITPKNWASINHKKLRVKMWAFGWESPTYLAILLKKRAENRDMGWLSVKTSPRPIMLMGVFRRCTSQMQPTYVCAILMKNGFSREFLDF